MATPEVKAAVARIRQYQDILEVRKTLDAAVEMGRKYAQGIAVYKAGKDEYWVLRDYNGYELERVGARVTWVSQIPRNYW